MLACLSSTLELISFLVLSTKAHLICSQCGYQFADRAILKAAGKVLGARGRGAAKARDPEKMRQAGRKGGLARARAKALEKEKAGK